jgi:hypothetical protein
MLRSIAIAAVMVCLLSTSSIAQNRGSFGGRPTYLVKTTRNNSFKPQRNAPKPYIARKTAVPSFSGKKFPVTPYIKKSAVPRGSFAHGMSSISAAGK